MNTREINLNTVVKYWPLGIGHGEPIESAVTKLPHLCVCIAGVMHPVPLGKCEITKIGNSHNNTIKRSFIAVMKNENGTFSGIERRYYPTPSGQDRWLDGLSDMREWETPEIAKAKMIEEIEGLLENGSLNNAERIKLKNLIEDAKMLTKQKKDV